MYVPPYSPAGFHICGMDLWNVDGTSKLRTGEVQHDVQRGPEFIPLVFDRSIFNTSGVKVEWKNIVTRTRFSHGVGRYYPKPHSFFCGPTQPTKCRPHGQEEFARWWDGFHAQSKMYHTRREARPHRIPMINASLQCGIRDSGERHPGCVWCSQTHHHRPVKLQVLKSPSD